MSKSKNINKSLLIELNRIMSEYAEKAKEANINISDYINSNYASLSPEEQQILTDISNNNENILSSLNPYFLSCEQILNSSSNIGDGLYTIDIDGFGPEEPYEVYCDMTT